jgi:ferrochelatase
MPFDPEPTYRHGNASSPGVLLVNLGTPDAPTAPALKGYLRQFLSDPRVVEIPKPLWWLILNGLILNIRPKKSAAKYRTIWTDEGSPLKVHTARQASLLQGYLGDRLAAPIVVDYAMRYGNPSIREGLARLRERGADRVLVIPLYPQAASSTTGSTLDAVAETLRRVRNVPALRFVKHFHDHPLYIQALAQSVRDHWAANGRPEKLVMSFHGLPRFHLEKGDPYHCECHKTGRLLAEALGLGPEQWIVTFQSRFGRAEWLKPYTQETLESIARAGVSSVDTLCPGFVSDCLETLEEIALENRAAFLAAGGREFRYIPCLNERHEWIEALVRLCLDNLQGWLPDDSDPEAAERARQASRARALAMGAPD